jgi:acyl-CoA synthetase (NDP forming)
MNGLHTLFKPRSVAVIGASRGATATGAPKLGTAVMRNLVEHGFQGAIHPVNPRETELFGRRCVASIRDIDGAIDTAVIVVPADRCVEAMRDCAVHGVKAAVVMSAGFAEAGAVTLQDELLAVARAAGIRMVGPNTAGFVDLHHRFAATISMVGDMRPFVAGGVAFITQSGALGGSMLGRGMEEGVGFSHWVTTGNQADLSAADYLDHLVDDPNARVFALFLESVTDGPRFIAAARRAARAGKPVLVYKSGASAVGAATGASHTGALAGSHAVFSAMCRQHGLIQVDDLAELLPLARTFAWLGERIDLCSTRARRVGVVSASGGICGVAADECELAGLEVPELSPQRQAQIRSFVPAFASVRNPVDVTGQIRSSVSGYQDTVRAVLDDDAIDAALLLVTMAAEPRASFYGREIAALAHAASKPLVVTWAGPLSLASKGHPMLADRQVPTFDSTRAAVRALAAVERFGAFQRRLQPVASGSDSCWPSEPAQERATTQAVRALDECDAKALLARYGVPVVDEVRVADPDAAAAAAVRIGYPVVLKGCGARFAHKTELGLVHLGLRDDAAVRRAAEATRAAMGDDGDLLVQQMVTGRRELLIGMVRDAQFGPVITFGLGGIFAEALADVSFRVCPVSEHDAMEMLDELRAAGMLGALRGLPAVDRSALVRALVGVSRLALERPDIVAIDVNPLVVAGADPIAVDALVLLR